MRVLFLGSGYLGVAILEALVSLHHQGQIELVGVFPWSKTKKGRTLHDEGEVALVKTIRKHKLKMIKCPGANHFEFSQHIQQLKPDAILVGCWGEILKAHLVQRPDIKLINCHPSLLPAHRGANPYVSTIVMGETETGVTFHWMGLGIDDGPILLQRKTVIAPDETGGSLRDKCCQLAGEMVSEVIHKLKIETKANGQIQDESKSSYFPQITLADGLISWELPAQVVSSRLRGLKPWLSSYSMLQGQLLFIFHSLQQESRSALGPNLPERLILQDASMYPSGELPEVPPGTIIAKSGSTLWLQGEPSDVVYRADDYQFYLGIGFLPRFISKFFTKHMARVGHRFLYAFAQGVVQQSQ